MLTFLFEEEKKSDPNMYLNIYPIMYLKISKYKHRIRNLRSQLISGLENYGIFSIGEV